MKKKPFLSKNIYLLSFISLFTDMASEMLYPIMPLYLKHIGYGVVAIGFIEGIADAISGITKGFFGYLSDKTGKRVLFLRLGYFLSAISKPLMGITSNVGVVFTGRLLDRFGKGIRTAPRDAILAIESKSEDRGKVFGFHRSMDTLGATLGPLLVLIFLYFYPGQYRLLFFLVAIPGLIAIMLTFLISDKTIVSATSQNIYKPQKYSFRQFFTQAPDAYKKILIGFTFFALLNSSDMFLLLRAKELGLEDVSIIAAYLLYNTIYTLAAFPVGYLSDKLGFKNVYIVGLIIFAVVYSVFARDMNTVVLFLTFGLYGIFGAIHESVGKAWLSRYLTPQNQGTGLGLYMSIQSVAFLLTSIATSLIWYQFGPRLLFSVVSLASLGLIMYFLVLPISKQEYGAPDNNK